MSDGGAPRRQHQVTHQAPKNALGLDPDAVLDATIFTGLFILALVLAWNINGCLHLYQVAGPKYASLNAWCN